MSENRFLRCPILLVHDLFLAWELIKGLLRERHKFQKGNREKEYMKKCEDLLLQFQGLSMHSIRYMITLHNPVIDWLMK